MMFSVPSKDKVNTGYPALPNDNYVAYISKLTPFKKIQKYDSFKAKGRVDVDKLEPADIDEVHEIELAIYSLKSTDPLKDVEGNAINPLQTRVWKQVNPKSVGYQKDNSPTHLRAFLAYTLRQDVDGDLSCDINDLVGKFVGVDLVVNEKGQNRVVKFTRVPESFRPDDNLIKEFEAKQFEKSLSSGSQTETFDSATKDFSSDEISISDVPF